MFFKKILIYCKKSFCKLFVISTDNKSFNNNSADFYINKIKYYNNKKIPFSNLIFLVSIAIISIWLFCGFYIVQPAQQAAVLRLGKFVSVKQSGLHWHLLGVTEIIKKNVEVLNTLKLEKLMLTSEENIVSVSFSVQYKIDSLKNYLFSTNNPELILKQSLESSVRQIIGENQLEKIRTTSRTKITNEVLIELKNLVDKYDTGIFINELIMQPAQAPFEVKSAFDDVIKAREDRERVKNEAQSYANKILPVSKGKAQRIIDEARAYQEKVVLEAEGNTANFSKLTPIYKQNSDIVKDQIYYDAIEMILKKSKLYIINGEGPKHIFYGDKLSQSKNI